MNLTVGFHLDAACAVGGDCTLCVLSRETLNGELDVMNEVLVLLSKILYWRPGACEGGHDSYLST